MSKQLFFRRCHHCDSVTFKQGQPVERCRECGKPLARFFYFDDQSKEIWSDSQVRRGSNNDLSEYGPIHGLTAYWEPF